jgi:hypothetical protein
MRSAVHRCAVVVLCFAAALAVYFLAVRPWLRGWGADDALRRATLPGDGLIATGSPRETRAVVIAAPAAAVWPWIAQIGQDRGGFYSFAVLENLAGCELSNLDHLDPSLQSWGPGDRLWMYPRTKAGGMGQAPLALHEPGRALVFYTRRPGTRLVDRPDGTWAFIVQPVDAHTSRFVVRSNGTPSPSLLGAAFEGAIFEPIHFVMERKMMDGVKVRAEGGRPSEAEDDAIVILWTMTFALFVSSLILFLAGRDPRRRLVTLVAAASAFAFLTLAQPPVAASAVIVLALGAAVFWPRRH